MKNSGFTIIESLVAVAILVTVIIGATGVMQSGISSYIFSKDQIAAFYLAQEGFEQIRNLRDENRLNSRDWLYDIAENSSDPCYFGSACTVSPVETSSATRCSSPGSCPNLRQDPDTGFFGYNTLWNETIFRREIELSSINADEVAVTVTVDWHKGVLSRQFKARENLLDW
jgi:prepilin-type N-terminal cleavage/methylation domain-containing protein